MKARQLFGIFLMKSLSLSFLHGITLVVLLKPNEWKVTELVNRSHISSRCNFMSITAVPDSELSTSCCWVIHWTTTPDYFPNIFPLKLKASKNNQRAREKGELLRQTIQYREVIIYLIFKSIGGVSFRRANIYFVVKFYEILAERRSHCWKNWVW